MAQKLRTSTRRRISPQFIKRLSSWLVLSTGLTLAATATAKAASYYWDSDGTAAGNAIAGDGLGSTTSPLFWDTTTPLSNWWDGLGASDVAWTNSFADTAVFTGTAGTVTLNNAISAGGLTFNVSGYTIDGNILTLGGGAVINVANPGDRETISSVIAGTNGLTKIGYGTLVLTNNANSFSGDVVINNGSIVITDPDQLGTGVSAISINGLANTGNPGYSGGQLVLQGGGIGAGLTINREISVTGRGPGAANVEGGLLSIGYNTIAGNLVVASTGSEGRVTATHGITTVTGGVMLGTGAASVFQGNGNWVISGVVTGFDTAQDRFAKSGNTVATTLWLQNSNNQYAQTTRIDSGTVRVSDNGALGTNTTVRSVDLNGGFLEVDTDTPNFGSRNIYSRANTNGVFLNRALGGSGLNQTIAFNYFDGDNATFTLNGRDGYGFSIGGSTGAGTNMSWSGGGNMTINNNLNGTATLNMNIQHDSETTARSITFGGNGETVMTGVFLVNGSSNPAFVKTGTGQLTLTNTTAASTDTGTTTINQGTLSFASGSSLPTGSISIGNATTTSGTLNYIGAGETLSRAIVLNTTTANDYLNANGTGALIVNGAMTAVAGNKTLVLGGSSTAANEIQSAIPNSTNLSLQKIGSGTWILSGANAFTGGSGVTVSGGTLKVRDTFSGSSRNVISDANAIVFNVDSFSQAAGGTFAYVGADSSASTESVGALVVTSGLGTVQVVPGASGTAALTFSSLGARTAGAAVNVLGTGVVNVTGTTGFLNAATYFDGADFAFSGSGTTLRAPIYGTDAGFVVAGAALTASSHNLVTADATSGALTISSLKIMGSQTVNQTGLLTIQTAANSAGGIIQTGGSGVVSGTGVTTGGSGDLVIRVDGSGDTLTMAVPITSTTTGGLTKTGAGLLVLQGAQAYTGTTTINEGEVQLATGSRLGGSAASNSNNLTIRQAGLLDINGNSIGVGAFNGAGSVTNSSSTAATLTVGNGNGSGYFTGVLSGNVGLIKTGTGTESLTGANTFTGSVTLSGGTLAVTSLADIGQASGIGAGDATSAATNAASLIFNGGTLQYTGANGTIFQVAQTPSVSIDRLFTLAGSGVIDSSGTFGSNVLSTNQNNAALIFNNTGDVAFSGSGTRTLTLQGSSTGDNELDVHLVNNTNAGEALALTKAGSGLWLLNPATPNTYTGATTISGGQLQAVDGVGLSSASNLVLAGGVVQTSGSFTRAIGATGGQVQWSSNGSGGFAASSSKLTVNLGGAGATVQWGAGGIGNGTGTLILSSATAFADTEFVNPIDLNVTTGTVTRTIQVDDNGNTGLDFATVSGVISNSGAGTAALTKSGNGTLIVGDANTYNGNTTISAGSLVVTSVGASGAAATSLGSNLAGGKLLLGNGGTTGANLLYVGGGEITTRNVTINTTTAGVTIDSSGSGALVLTSITNGVAGAKTLTLRGSNTDANMVTSLLVDNGGALSINKADGGLWILNPSSPNTFTGSITAGGGVLALTAAGIGSAASINLSNGEILAYGGDLTTSTPVILINNTADVFGGSNNITLNGTVTKQAGANDQTISNNLDNGAILTINGNFVDGETATTTRNINMRGYGSTVWNGILQNNANNLNLIKFDIRLANNASLTLGGANTLTGGILLGQGTLVVNNLGALGPTANTLTFDGGVLTSNFDLSGANKIANTVQLQGDPFTVAGSNNIEFGGTVTLNASRSVINNLDPGETFTLSGTITNSAAATLNLFGSGNTVIPGVIGTGTGAQGLQYLGTATLSLTGTNTMTGALTASRGTIVLSGTSGGSVNAASGITINQGGAVTLDNSGGNNASGRIAGRAVTLNGGTLNFIGSSTGTSETAGALTVNSIAAAIDMSGAGTNTLTFASVNFANSGSSIDLTGISGLGSTNILKFTTAPALIPVSTGILSRAIISGDFATYSAANGVVAFSAYNNSNNLDSAANTDTMNVTANAALGPNRTLNALKINGSGLTVSGANKTLTLTAAGILNTGGDNTLSIGTVNMNGQTGMLQVDGSTTLTLASSLINGAINKVGTGTLDLTALNYYGSTTNVSAGTLVLDGGLNTIFPASQVLNVGLGATVDLAGNAQYVGQLSSPGTTPNAGGTITTSTGTGTLVANYNPGSSTFSGQITGNVNFGRAGGNTLTLESAQTYTGATELMGGTTTLQDDATLLNTSSIDINAATLLLQNNANLQTANTNRIGDTIPITLRDGTISFNGRVDDAASETFGALSSAQGANTVTVTAGGTGTAGAFASADVTFASLTRTVGTTVNFTGSSAQGSIGNQPRILFTAAPTTYFGGVLGPWAIANSTDYAAYNTTNGVGTVGNGGYAGYEATFGSGNITDIGTISTAPLTTTLPAGTTTTAMLRLSGNFTNNLAFTNNGDVLNLQLGGILRSNNAFDTSIGTTATRGVITAGGTETSGVRELVIYNAAGGNPGFGGATINPTTNVVTMSSTVGLQPGMTVTNGNFPAGTTVVSVDSFNQVTLSQNSTNGTQQTNQTLSGGSFVNGVTSSGSAVVTMNSTVGVAPGMTITGTGIPAGTYVVSVDSPTQLTLSQNSTASGSSLGFAIGVSNMIVNSVIADNGFGNSVQLVKSGGGVLNLSANNTYSGGTVVDQGTLNLIGSGIVIPAGGVTLNNAVLVMNTNAGQIDPANAINLRQSSTLTLAGNNTLDSLSFDNNGGTGNPTVNTGGILTLTNATPIAVTSSNPLTIPVISGSLDIGSGAKTFNIGAIQVAGTTVIGNSPAMNISAAILSPGASITKTGAGVLELSGLSTFGGGLTVSSGGLVIGGNNSVPTQGGGSISSGPLGTGSVTMAAGTVLLIDNASRAIGNDITFQGTPTFDNTGTTAATMTLNGAIQGLPNGAVTMSVASPFLTVALLGEIPNIANITSFARTGQGTLQFNSTGYTGDFNVGQLSSNNAISIFNDGNGSGQVETVALGSVIFDSGVTPNITVGRAGGTLPYTQAQNKILAPASVNDLNLGLTVTNNNGYGLQILDTFTLPAGNTTFTVANATASNVTQGAYLNGKISGGSITKSGNGTLVLGNTGNDFAGNILINTGVVSVDSDLELGNAANEVVLNPTSGTATFRATDNITTSRAIMLGNTANTRSIEVVGGKTLELDTPFDLNAGAGTAASLAKNDQGVLILNAANSSWTGQLSILGGAVRVSANGALGTGATQVLLTGVFDAALQLSGGVTVANPINLNNSGTNLPNGGINSNGQLQNFSGTNTYSGAITLSADAGIGSGSGTLNITGGISMATTTGRALYFLGDGDITISGTSLTPGAATAWYRIEKIGNGTLAITNANTVSLTGDQFKIRSGTVVLSGAGTFTGSNLGNLVEGGATLDVDNSGTAIANRLGNHILNIAGGTFNYTLNTSSANTEAFGVTTFSSGGSTFDVIQNGTQNSTITFSTLAFGAGSSVNFTGALGTSTNKIVASTAPALTPAGTGILPHAMVNGNEFATYNATTGITAFSGYAAATNILSVGPTQTFKATNSTANSLTGNQTLNALTLTSGTGSPDVGGLSGLTPTTLTLTSGAILANGTGSGSTLSVPVVAVGGVEAILHVAAGQALNVSSSFTGTAGMTKSLPGVLNLNSQQFVSGNTTVDAGTLNLLAGTNTILPGAGLVVNAGGTVDLNGNAQFIGSLASQDAGVGAGVGGGIVTSSLPGATLATNTNTSFGGQITGSIYLAKAGGTLNLLNVNTYTGGTLINGGTLYLADSGTLSNTASIDINYGSLTIDNSRLFDNTDRVNDLAAITLRGGNITFQGRAQTASSETMGDVTLVEGNNSIFNTAGGTGVNTATLNFGALIRPAGSAATLRFNNAGAEGQINGVQTTFTQINGISTAALGGGLTNHIIGPWAIVDREYASYVPGLGIGAMNAVGFPTADAVGFTGPLAPNYNVRFGTSGTTVLSSDIAINTLTFTSPTSATTLDLGGHTLTLQGGGLLLGESSDNVNIGITDGFITAGSGGATDLYITHANYSGTNRTVSIDAVIEDNGGPLRLIKSSGDTGVSVMSLNGINTYTGGTVINQGTLVIGATGALGTGGITVGQAALTQTAGGGIPAQALTMNGGSTVTLASQANSLTDLTFNNNGGSAPTLNVTGTLTLTGSITSNPSNVGSQATITTGTVDLNGNNSFSIVVNPTLVNGQNVAPWSAGLIINSIIQNGGIVKTGDGMLQLSGQNTFAGGVTISSGGLIIASNSAGNALDDVVTSGPLGTGTLTMGANTTLLSTGAFTVANNVVFLGDTVFNGTNNLTLNGVTTLPSVWNATITAPQMTVTIGDATPSQPSDIINKSGLGTLVVGNYAGTIQATGGLVFTGDGNGFGTPENVSLGGDLIISGDTAITINHSGSAPNARNKTLQKDNLTMPGNILSITNQNGYGLEFTGTTTLTGPAHFAVGTATASNVVQGLTLSGVVSDGGSDFGITKSGLGTLVLGNPGNTFGGVGATIDVLNGILSVGSDGALGNANNSVTLDVEGTTGVGFRATGTFSTARNFILNQNDNALEVTVGNTLTLTTPFTLSAATDTLTKNDNGVLAINADNRTGPAWTGAITINAGAILALNDNALGTGSITIGNGIGAALQLSGGVTISNPLSAGPATSNGINSGGALESVSGVNTYSGLITEASGVAITIGADAGSTLNITGGITAAGGNSISFTGAGDINITTAGLTAGSSFNKLGSGTLTISVANPSLAAAQTVNATAGTLVLSGAGTLGPVGASTGAVTVDVNGTLTLDNRTAVGGNVNNRLGTNRPITLRGGTFNLIGNETVVTTETFAVPTLARGLTVITVTDSGAGTNLLFTGSANVPTNAQNSGTSPTGVSILFRGTNLGSAAGPGVATIKDTGSTNGFAFNGQSGAAGTKNKGIMPYALVDDTATGNGVSFATGDGTSFTIANVRKLASNEYETANTITSNDNILLTGGVTTNIAANVTVNSFTIDASANITLGNGVITTMSSGGLLVRSGSTSSISGGVLSQPNTSSPFNIWTLGDLTISSVINGGNGTTNGAVGFVKAGAGTLTLGGPTSTITGLTGMGVNSMSGQLVINQGTLKLNGGKNTIQANNYMAIDGGMLDLNGTSQQVFGLFTDGAVAGAGGTITSSSGTGNLIINEDNNTRNFAGTITGSVNLTRSGQNTWTLYSNQTYTGSTVINGGVTVLRDSAELSNTTSIDINYATLLLDNNGGTMDLTNRVNDAAPVTLRGGSITFQGRAATASSETLGDVTLAQGNSIITSAIGGTGINSADLTLTSLTRTVGGGTVNFAASTDGLIGSSSRILIPTINGVSTSTYGSVLTNDILGGWAIINTSDFASYVPGLGVGALGQQGFAQYSTKTLSALATPTDNIRVNYTALSTISDDTTINSVKFDNVALGGVAMAAGKTLTIASGGLLSFTNTSWSFGTAVNQGFLTSGGSELFIYTQGSGIATINSVIEGSGVSLVKSGANTATLAGTNTYDGGTFVNQGTLNVAATGYIPLAANPANGLVISNATVTLNAPGLIDSGNIVTINGGGVLNLFGDNTVAGLVFNNSGGTGNPSVVSFSTLASNGGPNPGAAGVLTIGSAGIVATSSNVGTTSNLFGRVDFGTSANTITVDTINVNGVTDVVPLQAGLALQGVINSSGGITKLGNGVLGLNAQQIFTGALNVNAGGVRIGTANGGSRFSALTLNANTRLDLAGQTTTLGSLSGSGTVFSSAGTPTLTVGYDNTDTTFSGSLSRFNDAAPNAVALTKIGTGTLTLNSAQSGTTGSSGTITVDGGGLTYSDAGSPFPSVPTATAPTSAVTVAVNTGGTLTLDNESGANLNNRLAMNNGAGTLAIQGGNFVILGNSGTNTQETVANVAIQNGGGTITLNADPASQLNMTIATLSGGNSTGSMVVRGLSSTSGNGMATLTITTPSLLSGQGTGANGTTTMAIRADTLGDTSLTGKGTGYLVKDSATGFWRPLAASELQTSVASWAATQNAGLSSAQTILANTPVNSLTISGTGEISSGLDAGTYGIFGPTGVLTMNLSGATTLLVLDGATGNIDTALAASSGGITPYLHVVGSGALNINGYFGIGGTAGMVKADDGVLNLNNRAFYTGGNTTVNGGTLNLNSGSDNTLAVVPGATTPTVTPLNVNGINAVVDLKDFNQVIGALTAVNPIPGQGGTVTNSGPDIAILTSTGGGTFSGQITGNIGFTRAGNNTTLLTNTNTYTGPTTVRGGTLQLRDSGALTNTTAITLDYGTLNLDNSGLSSLTNLNIARIPATAPLVMQGGTLTVNGGGSVDTTATINSLTVTGGGNSINVTPQINEGSTVNLTIGNLVRDPNNHSMVNFNGFTTNNSGGTSSTGGQGLSANGDIILNQVNGVTPLNLAMPGAATVAGSSTVTVASTSQLIVGAAVTGTGLPANEFITSIIDATHFTISTGTGVTAQSSTTVTAKNLTNNLLGGWAVADGNSFATYVTGFGVSIMGQTTQGIAAPGFDGSDITGATTATQNISDGNSGTTRTISANKAANSWRLVPGAAETVTLGAGTGVTLGVGIITNANQTISIAGTNNTSTITTATPGSDLYVYINQGTTLIGAKLTGNMNLVKSGGATLTLNNPAAVGNNDYTGGTFVQAGTLNLTAGAAGVVLIPGDLTINNATVTMNTNAGQIASTSNIFINGGGILNMTGTNTLASVTFDNQGGTGNPTLAGSTSLTLSATNAITANNDSLATTPVISGTALVLSDAAPVITTTGLSPNDLNITAIITSAGGLITKMGDGSLTLSGANTFNSGFNLTQGTLIFGVNTTGTLPAITNGPVGTGTLTIGDGTTVLSDANRVVGNPTTVTGDFTFGGVTSTNNLTLSGAMNLGATGRTITVSSPAVTGTISGAITSTATDTALTKAGKGALVLASNANNFGTAGLTVADGILKNGIANAIPNATPVTINAAAEYDLNGFAQAILHPFNNNGVITNSGAAATLSIGGTSATDTTTPVDDVISTGVITNGANGLTLAKVGAGMLTITTTNNTYLATSVVSGKVVVGADNALPLANRVTIGTAGDTASATLDVSNFNQTAGSVTFSGTGGTDSLIIGAGHTLTLTGADGATSVGGSGNSANNVFRVGGNVTTGSATTNAVISGGGTLTINNAAANFAMDNVVNPDAGATGLSTLDLTGLAHFNATVAEFRVGFGQRSQANLLLSPDNHITATTVRIGDSNGLNAAAGATTVGLGQSNVINTNTLNVGVSKGLASVGFQAGLVNPTLVIRGAAGGNSTADLNLATLTGTAAVTSSSMVFTSSAGGSDGSLDAMFGTVTIGSGALSGATGVATGLFEFDNGTVSANTINLGNSISGSTGTATSTGTINVKGGSLTVGTIHLGNKASTTQGAAGVLNLTGGTTTLTGDITDGGGTSTVNLNGGTLNMGGHNLGSATQSIDTLTLAAGTLQNVGQINNGAAISKTTSGTLNIAGTNTWTGATNITAGTLIVSGSIQGDTTIASGAILASGNNISSQVAAINAASDAIGGGTVAPGNTGGVANLSTIGQLNATGGVTLGTSSTAEVAHLSIEVGGTNDGTTGGNTTGPLQYDRLAMSGNTLTLNNANLDISPVNSYSFSIPSYDGSTHQFNLDGHIFFLITGATNVAGTFANQQGADPNLTGFATIYGTDGQEFAISYTANFATDSLTGGTDVAIMAIPEPNSLSMLAGSFGVALGLQRMRRRRKA